MKSQYSTIGIIGIYETLQKYGDTYKDSLGYTHYTDDGIKYAVKILDTIKECVNNFDCDYSINIEQVPAERCAAILMEKDKFFYPKEKYELPLYGNQWIPLGVKTTIDEKIKLSAILDKACNGGSIAHINIDTPFKNFKTAWKMLNYIAEQGVVYFAFCTRISACENNHGFYGDVCPTCGKPKVTTYQRIVGFLTPEKTYSKERKDEFKMRDWFSMDDMGNI
jgi:ribonucleoside-triphosphate reductase